MITQNFFEAFTELDDDLIENALPQTQELGIASPAERIHPWKPIAVTAAAAAAVCGIVVGVKIYSANRHAFSPADSYADSGTQTVSAVSSPDPADYSYISIDQKVWSSTKMLVDASDYIVYGKVTDISFELHHENTGELLTEYSDKAALCTVYEVKVDKTYKGDAGSTVRIITYNGLEGYNVGEQQALVGKHYIPVLENPDDIIFGGKYLFLLKESYSQSSNGGTMTCLLNHGQGSFRADMPTVKERHSQASLNDIVDFLTNTVSDEKKDDVSVIHGEQTMWLSNQQSADLMDAVLQTVTDECQPDVELNMTLSEQRIKEYGKNGFVISIEYKPSYGVTSDKMARGICSVTVLIGGEGEASYIQHISELFNANGNLITDTHCFALSDTARERLLKILGDDIGSDPYPANYVYSDDDLVPAEWLRLDSRAEFENRLAEAMAADTTVTDPEEAVKALMDRNMFFICLLFYGGIFDTDWDSPRDYSDYKFPIYPCTSELFNNVKDISNLAYDTYSDSSVADSLLYGAERRPRWLEIDGQMYVDNTTFPLRGGVAPFIARSYIEITEKSENKCTFILHYPCLQMLKEPESGYEFYYHEFGPYTAERIDGKWKLNEYVIDTYC